MFQVMFSPIIRSTWLYLQYLVVFTQVAAGWCPEWVETGHCGLCGVTPHNPQSTLAFTSYSLYGPLYIWCALFFMSRDYTRMVLWYRSPCVCNVPQLISYILKDFVFRGFRFFCFQALYRDIIFWARARAYACDVCDLKWAEHIMRTLRFR